MSKKFKIKPFKNFLKESKEEIYEIYYLDKESNSWKTKLLLDPL